MRVGDDFVVIENIRAGVCRECGERYHPPGVVDRLRDIEVRIMDRKGLTELDLIGRAYRIRYDLMV